jgi:hypothetical protein
VSLSQLSEWVTEDQTLRNPGGGTEKCTSEFFIAKVEEPVYLLLISVSF